MVPLRNALDGQSQHLESLCGQIMMVRFEIREFATAIGAPARPKIDQDRMTFSAGVRLVSLDFTLEVDIIKGRERDPVAQNDAGLFGWGRRNEVAFG